MTQTRPASAARHNAQRTRSNRYEVFRRGSICINNVDSPGGALRLPPPEPRMDAPPSRRPAHPNVRVRCRVFSQRVNNRSLTSSLPRARSPQAPGRSFQSSADVGDLRGRSRTPRYAEYVAFPAPPIETRATRARSPSCQVSRHFYPPTRTGGLDRLFSPRFATGFRRERREFFFLGPRLARGAQTLPPARAGSARSRADRISSRRGADVSPR